MNESISEAKHKKIEATFAKAHIASYEQQLGFSNFNKELYGNGPVTRPGVKYTVIEGRYDDAVVPFTNAFLNEPGVKKTSSFRTPAGTITPATSISPMT
ncbi:triacylglycerol lipase precursor [Cutibacterium acnes JCM 18916]|nr:triacylglycerol lipase precursor [Cutibacterium acnes JCM 18916]